MKNSTDEIVSLAKAVQKTNSELISQKNQLQKDISAKQKRLHDIQNEISDFAKLGPQKELQNEFDMLTFQHQKLQNEKNSILEEIDKIKELMKPAIEKYCQEREMCKTIKEKKKKATTELEKLNEYLKKVSTTTTVAQQNRIIQSEFEKKEEAYNKKLDELDAICNDLQIQYEQMQEDRSKTKCQINEQIQAIKALEDRRDRRDNTIDKLDRSIKEKSQEYNEKDDYLTTLKKECAETEKDLDCVLKYISKTKNAIEKMKLQTAEQKQKKLEVAAKFGPLEKAFKDKINEIQEKSKQKYQTEIDEYDNKIKLLESDINAKQTELENAQKQNSELKEKLDKLKSESEQNRIEQEKALNDLNLEKAQLAQKLAEISI